MKKEEVLHPLMQIKKKKLLIIFINKKKAKRKMKLLKIQMCFKLLMMKINWIQEKIVIY